MTDATRAGDDRAAGDVRAARPRVLVTRAAGDAASLVASLQRAGIEPLVVPAIAIEPPPDVDGLVAAVGRLGTVDWVVVTSANGARAVVGAARRLSAPLASPSWAAISWAAIGRSTGDVLLRAGLEVRHQPSVPSADALATELPLRGGERVLVVRGDLAGEGLAARLRDRGARVEDVIGYRTVVGPETGRTPLRAALAAGLPAAVLFASGSAVRGLLRLAAPDLLDDCRRIPAICIGPRTSAVALDNGFRILGGSDTDDRTAEALAATTARLLAPVGVTT